MDELNWEEAEKKCREEESHLASIISAEENQFIYEIAKLENVWLGGKDFHNDGAWQWVDNSMWNFTAWKSGEPNRIALKWEVPVVENGMINHAVKIFMQFARKEDVLMDGLFTVTIATNCFGYT